MTCIQTTSFYFLAVLSTVGSLMLGFKWGFSRALGKKLNATYQKNLHAFRENVKGRNQ